MEEVLLGYASFFSLTCYSLETGRTQDCFLGAIECFLCFECCKGCCECFADILCTLPPPSLPFVWLTRSAGCPCEMIC